MKAFLVDCDGEYGAQLYFADTRGQAKMLAANDEDTDITGVVSCKRRPQYDQYAPGPVPVAVLLEDGWWFECSGCGQHVHGDEDEHWHGQDACSNPTLVIGQQVWCCELCKQRAEERERKYALEIQQKEATARLALLARFADAQIERVDIYGRAPIVTFRVPVPTENAIMWEVGDSCVNVTRGDLAAWYHYEDQRCAHLAVWEGEGGALI